MSTKPRLLIVDDEADIVETLRFGLSQEGFDVEVAFDGLAGLDAAQSNPPDLMVLDVMLPGCNGYEVSRQLKEWMGEEAERPAFPILLLTARKVNSPDREQFVATWSRADEMMYKPFEMDDLLGRIRALLGSTGADAPQVMS